MRRELERKFEVKSPKTQSGIDQAIKEALGLLSTQIEVGLDRDVYWNVPGVDFVRLRQLSNGEAELTAKLTDRGTIEDRVEETAPSQNFARSLDFLKLVHGEPLGEVSKSYTKFHLDYFTEVATYKVLNDKRVFLEIEADSIMDLDRIQAKLEDVLRLEQVHQTVFQLFIKKES